jgi:predicted transposase/invertase (TIGR01784 family)
MSGENEPLHQPHDKLFKLGFSDPATAAAFLREHIPARISEALDWDALELLPGSFIDPRFRAHESDLLFAAPMSGHAARIYLLFEHQTTEDKLIALRLMRYMVSVWERHLADSPGGPLPVILPVVLAQNDREWKLRPEFGALFSLPETLANDLRP